MTGARTLRIWAGVAAVGLVGGLALGLVAPGEAPELATAVAPLPPRADNPVAVATAELGPRDTAALAETAPPAPPVETTASIPAPQPAGVPPPADPPIAAPPVAADAPVPVSAPVAPPVAVTLPPSPSAEPVAVAVQTTAKIAVAAAPTVAPAGPPAPEVRPAAPAVRVITAPGLAPPPAAATPPQRVAPPQPPALPAAPIVPRRLAPVVVEDAATLGAGRLHLRLPGVVAVPLDETCRDAAGQIWPCGRRALAAIRAFVRGRTVTCPLPKTARTGTFDVACTIGGIDLATWAVEQGWARPDESSETARAAAETAQREGRGVHRSVAPPVAPLPDAGPNGVDVPPDRTTAPLAGGTAEAPPRVVEAPARALPPTVEAAPLPPVTVAPPPVPPASVSRPLAAGPEGPMRLIP